VPEQAVRHGIGGQYHPFVKPDELGQQVSAESVPGTGRPGLAAVGYSPPALVLTRTRDWQHRLIAACRPVLVPGVGIEDDEGRGDR
jgi:hypothetical protein